MYSSQLTIVIQFPVYLEIKCLKGLYWVGGKVLCTHKISARFASSESYGAGYVDLVAKVERVCYVRVLHGQVSLTKRSVQRWPSSNRTEPLNYPESLVNIENKKEYEKLQLN